MFTSGTTVCLFINWPREQEREVAGTQGVMKANDIFLSGTKRQGEKFGVSKMM